MTKINDNFNLFQPRPESAFLTNSSGKIMKLIFLLTDRPQREVAFCT